MIIKYLGSVLPAGDFENRVVGTAWSPNNLKLAVALSDRSIYLFDEAGTKKDRFQTKPVDSKYGKKSYLIKAIAFSPDSTKIAVGQTDNIVYVYKIGEEWGEKKVICNKFGQSSAVTCMVWSMDGPLVIGLADGKVRMASIKSHKAQTLYTADAMTIALAMNIQGTGFLSSHADGSIIRYYTKDDGASEVSGRFLTHGVPAYALAWTQNHIMAGGCDKRLTFYSGNGTTVKTFDYSRDEKEKEFSTACCSPSGQSVAIGSWDRLRIFDWSPRKSIWEESNVRELKNFYTITSMSWRRDGSRLIIGGLCGAVEQFETILRRSMVRGSHEIVYVGPSQVVVRSLKKKTRPIIIKSQTGSEIEDVRVLGRRDNHVVARTANTLLISDIELNLMSEILWDTRAGTEKFFFEYPGVCLIFNAGELTIIEYGENEILGAVRTEAVNPHVVSVRINERRVSGTPDNKRLAYLLDPRTVRTIDLVSCATLSIVAHDSRVDWLELSETGHRLLSRDKRGRLWLSDETGSKQLLLSGTSFVSWVPGSDVAVGQSNNSLAIWYNVDAPEAATILGIRGDAIDVVRENGQTGVIVEEPSGRVTYVLDEGLIEFGTALHDNDFGRVVLFLEEQGDRPQTEAMWENVGSNAMSMRKLLVAARCYAALGDVACSEFLRETANNSEDYARRTGNDPLNDPDGWARLAILNGELKTAEAVYLERNELEKALEMYQKYWRWEEALELAESRNWSGANVLRDKHLSWLLESGQTSRAASIIEKDNPRRAVKLYLESKRAGRAARLLLANESLLEDSSIVAEVVKILGATDLMELAGEILEKTSDFSGAIECYGKAGVFARALDLARSVEPDRVVKLEKDWGQHLSKIGHYDAAIYRFIQAGENELAFDCAINAKQWSKALELVRVIEPKNPEIRKQCVKLAEHYASLGSHDLAEELYLRVDEPRNAVEVNVTAGNWSRAHELALEFMKPDEARKILSEHADRLVTSGDYRHAEALLVAIEEYDAAIAMYRKAGLRSDMIRLVGEYRSDLLKTTHAHLARELEAAGKTREAEEHFIGADDWRAAVAAYRAANLWEDALRVAKKSSGDKAAHQVALLWARTMAPELGARLLQRFRYTDECLRLACEAGLHEWALDVVKYGTTEQQKEIYYKHAMALEDEGKFAEAEKAFVKAGKAYEAVQMYIHTRDWEAAEEVAESLDHEAVSQVLVARAAEAAATENFGLAETLLLRAHKPDIIVEHYKKAGMWSDAMRVCREYLPSQEAALRRELSQKSSGMDASDSLAEARRWLIIGETRTALDILMVDPHATRPVLLQAADILINQADPETAVQLGGELGKRLMAIDENALAAQVYLQADRLKEAVNALIVIGEWNRARRVVGELAPELESYLEEKYREAMTREGNPERSLELDPEAGSLETMARKGQWSQLFEAASAQGTEILHKYVAQRSVQLMKTGSAEQALHLHSQFGVSNIPQYRNLYSRLAEMILTSENEDSETRYSQLAKLRTLLLDLSRAQENSSEPNEDDRIQRYLKITHFSAVKCGLKSIPALLDLRVKISVTLLRYTDVLPADRCYYEAGIDKRSVGASSEAFVFLNHFLDLEECIEEGESGGILDVDDLRVTDFPLEVPLPDSLAVDAEKREEAREWVLAISMDQGVEQGLPLDQRGVYIGSITSPHNESNPLEECAITGAPIRGPIVRFDDTSRVADRNDWNKLLNAARQSSPESTINDILLFVQEWCGTVPSYTF